MLQLLFFTLLDLRQSIVLSAAIEWEQGNVRKVDVVGSVTYIKISESACIIQKILGVETMPHEF